MALILAKILSIRIQKYNNWAILILHFDILEKVNLELENKTPVLSVMRNTFKKSYFLDLVKSFRFNLPKRDLSVLLGNAKEIWFLHHLKDMI